MPGPPRTYATNAARQQAYRERCRAVTASARPTRGLPARPGVAALPATVRWRALVRQAQAILGNVCAEMEAYYDQRSETWRDGERGEAFLSKLEALREAEEGLAELEL